MLPKTNERTHTHAHTHVSHVISGAKTLPNSMTGTAGHGWYTHWTRQKQCCYGINLKPWASVGPGTESPGDHLKNTHAWASPHPEITPKTCTTLKRSPGSSDTPSVYSLVSCKYDFYNLN